MLCRTLLLLCSLTLLHCQKTSNEKYFAATFAKVSLYWDIHNYDNKYKILLHQANWFQADAACQRSNMKLASVTSYLNHLKVTRSISLNGTKTNLIMIRNI